MYNSLVDLPETFAGLGAQTYPAVRVLALDNASTDGSVDWIRRRRPEVELICNSENVGFGRAHNKILTHCGAAPYYLALNPDVRMESRYIECIVRAMEAKPQIGWATGKLLLQSAENRETGKIYSVGHALFRDGYAINIGYGMADGQGFNHSREIFGAPGAAVCIRRELITDIAPSGELFDRDMFMYGEDVDMDWRARLQGWRCWYVADATALHRGSTPGSQLRAEAVANRYLSVIKNAYLLDLVSYNLPLICLHCLMRLVLTPREGLYLIRHILGKLPGMFKKRRSPQILRAEIVGWFEWSRLQPGEQPKSWLTRFKSFFARRSRGGYADRLLPE